ncbi:MAG: hypothetical protein LBH65_00475 [Desulfovibrio sp.]|jgi:hypothetical protein|nr:hypothetical protein [Desulfovibrio sp.]
MSKKIIAIPAGDTLLSTISDIGDTLRAESEKIEKKNFGYEARAAGPLIDKGSGCTTFIYSISLKPKILCSMAEIKEAFRVCEKTVQAWIDEGAPIALEGKPGAWRYSVEMVTLQSWRSARRKAKK